MINRDLWARPSCYLQPDRRGLYDRTDERLLSDSKSEKAVPPSSSCDWLMRKYGGGERI